ncbi:MAG: GMC family oxidoreductase [Actinomycetota bacterium]
MPQHWVVVGAGSAGCVVAARLVEAGVDVTLVEAGPALRHGSVPGSIAGLDFFDAMVEPERVEAGLDATRVPGGEPHPYVRGRGEGGCSAVNAMIALPGGAAWREPFGDAAAWSRAQERVAIPIAEATDDQLGAVDRALLAAVPDARRAPLTQRDGQRVTSAEAYVWPHLDSTHLTSTTDTTVDRVLFEDRSAVGVRCADGSEIDADRVVLCAGAIQSPAILMRSGVDRDGLGSGLSDHPSVSLVLDLVPEAVSSRGRLAAGALVERDGTQVLSVNHLDHTAEAEGLGSLLAALIRPVGRRGRVSLHAERPDDPQAPPVVEFDLVGDRRDLAGLTQAARTAIDVSRLGAIREISSAVYVDAFGTTVDDLIGAGTDRFATWLRSGAGDYVHAAGTCAVGAVTTPDGQVLGRERLYVCDASLFPVIPDANTHLPTTMLAELVVDRWITAGIMDE